MPSAIEPTANRRPDLSQRGSRPAGGARITALDFTKGALVLFMVAYHWLNYFVGLDWPHYRYLRFLTPSFVFITGFIISNVYLTKYDPSDPRLARRLFVRGLKLVGVFIALNAARIVLLPVVSNHGPAVVTLDPAALLATFVTGDFTSKVVAFYILVPIAYVLMLCAILAPWSKANRYIFHIACICLFAMLALLQIAGSKRPNLEIIAIGFLGILAGFIPLSSINRAIRHPYAMAVAYLLYTAAIAEWNVPYPLEVAGTCLTVTILYMVGTVAAGPKWINDEVILLGRYSLWGYISQIVILQLLRAAFHHSNLGAVALPISFAAAVTFTVLAVEIVHRGRAKAPGVDRLYRAVFA